MRSLILWAAIAICTCNAKDADFNFFSDSDCTKSGIYCLNSNVRINCKTDHSGNYHDLGQYDCSLDMQICCKGLCQDPREPCSGGDSDLKFQCSETGTFPDLVYCKKYHVCNDFTLEYSADCACNPYDLIKGMCGEPPCMDCSPPNVDCNDASKNGLMQPYPPMAMDSSIFYICKNSTAYTMGKCPDEGTLNDQNQCMPDCRKNSGPFVDANDCHRFIVCDSNNMLNSIQCPPGEGYADSQKACVPLPSEELPGCQYNGSPQDLQGSSNSTTTPPTSRPPTSPGL